MTKCSHKTKGEFQLIWLAALAANQQKVEDEQTNGQADNHIYPQQKQRIGTVSNKIRGHKPGFTCTQPSPSFLAWFVNTFISYSVHVEEFLLVNASK